MIESAPESIPTDDRGLLLGDGLFETVRLYRGKPFRLERHLARLESGALTVGIPVPPGLRASVATAVASGGGEDAALRITLTRGPGDGLAPPPSVHSRLILRLRPLVAAEDVSSSGLRALIRGRLDERSLVATLKSIGYLERIQALRLAREEGSDEALIRNSRDRVVEGSSSNLLAVRGATLFAPGPEEGALPGITRELLLEIARSRGMSVTEQGLSPRELVKASEVMLSSTLRGVAPVVEIEGKTVGAGVPGPVCRALTDGLAAVVARELEV